MSRKREIERVLRRLRKRQRRLTAVRWPVMLSGAVGLLAWGLVVLPRSDGGPVPMPRGTPSEIACQRDALARELYQGLTPLQRSPLDRLEPVVIVHSRFTRQQREQAWRLAAVRGAQFPFSKVSRITALLQKKPAGSEAGPGDVVCCRVRVEFACRGSAVTYSGMVRPTG